jgi:GH15 family glucan-1,4-alpha-glucosidase
MLDRAESPAGESGLLTEEVDARTSTCLGNMPPLHSHAELAG